MNPFGANTWIWVSPLTDERLAELGPRIKDWGFEVIEVPVENPGDWDPGRAGELLSELGMGSTVVAAMAPGRELVDADGDTIASTQGYLRGCVDTAEAIGAKVVAGPIYSSVGRVWRMTGSERSATYRQLAEGLRPVADYAGEHGVTLALEPLNRFETSLVNTVEQALEIVDVVDSPALGLLVDTFHMNIEEKSQPDAIRAAGSKIAHFHACGSDRGTPGADHIDWTGIAGAVRDAGYDGPVCIESFTSDNETIATAAAIWRPLAESQDALATDGLAYLREVFSKAEAG